MKSTRKNFFTNHIIPIAILFIITSLILILTGTFPTIATYNIYEYYNLFMYFVYILAIIITLHFFIYYKLYFLPFQKICNIFFEMVKNSKKRKKFFLSILTIIGMAFASACLVIIHAKLTTNTPNTLGTYFNPYRFLFIFAIMLIGLTLYKLRNQLVMHIEKALALIVLICGLLMIYSVHINTSVCWDDHIHYNTANSLIGLTEYSRTDMERLFHDDVSNENFLFTTDFFNMQYVQDTHQLYMSIEDNGSVQTNSKSYTDIIQKICYMPSAFFLFLGKLFNFPFHVRYQIGKLGNLLVYVIAAYLGVKKLKSGKMLLSSIFLIPTNLFIATNYSYDFWVTSLSLLGFSYFFSEMQNPDEKLSKSSAIIMIGSLFLAFTPKAVYFPLLAILYLLPKKKFKSKKVYKQYIFIVTVAIIYLLLSFLIPSILSGPSTDLRGGSDVNGAAQVMYILRNPLEYTKTLLSFLKQYLSINNTKDYTTYLAYYGHGSKYISITLLVILYAFLDRSNIVSYTSKIVCRIFTFFCCFCSICLVATALFVAFTPVGSTYIAGCQSRYLMPTIFPFLYMLGSSQNTGYYTKNAHYLISLSASSFLLLATFWTTCIGLYY